MLETGSPPEDRGDGRGWPRELAALDVIFLVGTWRRSFRVPAPELSAKQWDGTALWPWLIALGALVLLFTVVLRPGVRVGW